MIAVAVVASVIDCPGASANHDSPASPAASAIVVDSARPMAEMLAAFQRGVPRPDSGQWAAPDRETLVRSFVAALESADTARLAELLIDRAEFAWLYFPHSTIAKPPYELDPALAWFQMRLENERGLGRLLRTLGGQHLAYQRHDCSVTPQVEGTNRIWRECTVTFSAPDGRRTQRLFMSIWERDGRFKFFSYANRLD